VWSSLASLSGHFCGLTVQYSLRGGELNVIHRHVSLESFITRLSKKLYETLVQISGSCGTWLSIKLCFKIAAIETIAFYQ
jgi:hypothetical protein